jgi:2-dehydro-3-deoxyphosphogluconate aldolase / (4S)-4-hydroxy-2-oxoglutarate aldolase
MNDSDFIKFVAENRIFAVVRAESAEAALRAAEATIIGGIKLIEVSLSTPGEFRVISELRRVYGDRACIGAGSVTSEEQADRAIKSGAQFITMPHTNKWLIEACRKHRAFPVVGALTPTEVAYVWSLGAPLITIFPAFALGGADYIAALTSRMPGVRLVASGDVGPDNIAEYFSAGAFAISIGQRLFTRGDLQNQNYVAIAERARGIRRLAGVQ